MDKKQEDTKKSDEKESEDGGKRDLQPVFQAFSRFGDSRSDGETITLKNMDKWFKQAKLLGGNKPLTNADTAITFSKIAKTNKKVDLEDFMKIVEQLASDKKLSKEEIIEKLVAAKEPGMTNVTTPVTSGAAGANLERMTDTKKYTGSHKERFDEEGHGKGIEGREERTDDSGYVSGYKKDKDKKKGSKDDKEREEKDEKEEKEKKEEKEEKK